jgi:hypothetical protein
MPVYLRYKFKNVPVLWINLNLKSRMPWWILSMFIILGEVLYKTVLRIHIILMRIRIRIQLVTLMRICIWILASKTLKKCSNGLIFHAFWLVICKFKQIRIQLITFIRIQLSLWSGSYLSIWCGTCSKTLDRDIFNTDKYNFAILFFFRENIKGAKSYIYPDGKHNLHLKYSASLNKMVQDFLSEWIYCSVGLFCRTV